MVDPNEWFIRLASDPRRQYRLITAVGLPILVLAFFYGSLSGAEFLEWASVLLVGPAVAHRMLRPSPGVYQESSSLASKQEDVAWRFRLEDPEKPEDGVRVYSGPYLDDPQDLEEYLHSSFICVESTGRSELWVSSEIQALVRREGLHVAMVAFDEEETFREALTAPRTAGWLAPPPDEGDGR